MHPHCMTSFLYCVSACVLSVYLSTAMMLWDLGYRGDCMGGEITAV